MSEEPAKLQRALAADPSNVELRKALGNAHRAAGDLGAAIACYRECLRLQPDYLPALYNLGATARDAGLAEEAEASFRRLCALDPSDADAHHQLGTLLLEQDRAVEARPPLAAACRLQPDNPVLHWLLGAALASQGHLKEAREPLEKAVAIDPGLHRAWLHLGHVYSLLRLREEAVRAYRLAEAGLPDDPNCAEALLFELQHVCDWSELEARIERRRRDILAGTPPPSNPFSFMSVSENPVEQLACARLFAAPIERRTVIHREKLGLAEFARPQAGRKIRIGYLSADYHEHPTAYLAAELFELHDRSRFEVLAYSYGPDDRSAIRTRLRAAFDGFVDLRESTDADAARAIHRDAVDILIDLKGFTAGARPGIVALRPAPLQVSYLAYPGTMGASFIDYVVLDRYIAEGARQGDFSEKLVVLPGCYQSNDRTRAVPKRADADRSALGLPPEGAVLCCFNQPYKILPAEFGSWMRILARVPHAVLWLLHWNERATANLRAEARARGIDPERLVFSPLVPVKEHLKRVAAADLFLDTFPYNAHTTASDALWAGVAVLTREGRTFASRVAGSLLSAMGLRDLIARTSEEYERRAIELAQSPEALGALRARVEAARTGAVLFDTPYLAGCLEAAYRQMWEAHCAGSIPADLYVELSRA